MRSIRHTTKVYKKKKAYRKEVAGGGEIAKHAKFMESLNTVGNHGRDLPKVDFSRDRADSL